MVKLFRHVLALAVLFAAGSDLWVPADVHEADAVRSPFLSDLPGAGAAGGGPAINLFGAVLHAQQPPPKQQDEFVPIDELPAQDQLPAAPLLVAAYSFVVLALFAYVVSVARRVGVVQRELERLGSELKRSGRT